MWFDTFFERWVRVALCAILVVLAVAAFLYVIFGSWWFHLDVDQIMDWFLFTGVVFVIIAVVAVCLKAIIVLFGGGFFLQGFQILLPVVLIAFLGFAVFVLLSFVMGYGIFGYPLDGVRELLEKYLPMLKGAN